MGGGIKGAILIGIIDINAVCVKSLFQKYRCWRGILGYIVGKNHMW